MNDTVYTLDHVRLRVSEDIVPLGEFRTQTARVLSRLRASQRSVVITQNGRPAAVLVTPEEYDRLQEQGRFVSAVADGLADVEAGRLVDDEHVSEDDTPRHRRSHR